MIKVLLMAAGITLCSMNFADPIPTIPYQRGHDVMMSIIEQAQTKNLDIGYMAEVDLQGNVIEQSLIKDINVGRRALYAEVPEVQSRSFPQTKVGKGVIGITDGNGKVIKLIFLTDKKGVPLTKSMLEAIVKGM